MPESLDKERDASIRPSMPATTAAVQPHGCLVAFDSDWQGVCLASANLSRFFGLSPAEALGRPPEEVLGTDVATALARGLAKGNPGMTIPSGQADVGSRLLYVSTYMSRRHVILEVEPSWKKAMSCRGSVTPGERVSPEPAASTSFTTS